MCAQVLPVLQERFPIQRARMRLRLQVSSTACLPACLPWLLDTHLLASDFARSGTDCILFVFVIWACQVATHLTTTSCHVLSECADVTHCGVACV